MPLNRAKEIAPIFSYLLDQLKKLPPVFSAKATTAALDKLFGDSVAKGLLNPLTSIPMDIHIILDTLP